MKRELKVELSESQIANFGLIARPIPMKRELKEWIHPSRTVLVGYIARPIPMKRELKDVLLQLDGSGYLPALQGPSR